MFEWEIKIIQPFVYIMKMIIFLFQLLLLNIYYMYYKFC